MSDFFNAGPPGHSTNPEGHKAHHEANAHKLHTEGAHGFGRQVLDLLIGVAILAAVVTVFIWIFR
ncbi:hypothetical protein [Paenibacillus glufosinatiresistens]|uniref:hypothetical protein n=1 Tax=Paenibacillus glufosinatiresistens TaxID=3070657 RepID=UPI00286E01B5|nr:hypothetical protein [Paenibacillus sp. YX.27]